MQSKPLVSVVMPVYGVEKYIENSVKSVIAQTYDKIELIIVDDGCLDKSVEIAEVVLKNDGFDYVIIHQNNSGIGNARNTGLRQAHGEWVVFFDSDDILLPQTIEKLVNATCDKDVDIAFSKFNYVYDISEIKEANEGVVCYYQASDLQNEFLLRNRVILASGTMMRKKLLMDVGLYFSDIPWSEDQHFIWRLLSVVRGAAYIDEALYQYLQHPGSIMSASGIEKMIISYYEICKLPNYYKGNNELAYHFLVPRWVLGNLNAAARITEYDSWCSLYERIDGKRHVKTLFSFPDLKVKLAAMLCNAAPKKYYTILRKRK